MAYIEHDQLDAQLKKLENVCSENGFTYKFIRDKYPVRIIIMPDGTMDGQMSMLDNPVGYNTKGSALAFVFVDGDVYLNPGKDGGLSMSKRLQNKLRTIAEKVYFNFLKAFFIDTLESKKMADKLRGDEGDDTAAQEPEFEAIGDGDDMGDEDSESDEITAPDDAQETDADDFASYAITSKARTNNAGRRRKIKIHPDVLFLH